MAAPGLQELRQRRPEWQPWLAVVEEVLRELANDRWLAAVPAGVHPARPAAPLLDGARIEVPSRLPRQFLQRLLRAAAARGTAQMKSLAGAIAEAEALPLLAASLRHDVGWIRQLASRRTADPEALQALAALLSTPFLHACRGSWGSALPQSWVEGYCPLCGTWPAFAEVLGIDRDRAFRCGRCGVSWHAESLQCPYCGNHDHDELVSLVPEHDSGRPAVEACRKCLGYVKTFTRLQGCAPADVLVEDLASVDLDLAAIELGYSRPERAGHPPNVTLVEESGRSFLAWQR